MIQCCFYGFYCVTIEGLEFFSKNLLACLHEDTSSLRLFSVPRWGLQIIKYFSHRHKLHLLEQGLYDTACFKIFQEIRKLSLVLICRRTTCDTVAGTAWDTVPKYENIRRRQQHPSQAFAADVPTKLTKKVQLRRHVGGSSGMLAKKNEAGDRRRCTSGKYSPQFITSKMADVLAFSRDFFNSPGARPRYIFATTAMHLGQKITSTSDNNAGHRR